jgi:hypothetical protein
MLLCGGLLPVAAVMPQTAGCFLDRADGVRFRRKYLETLSI